MPVEYTLVSGTYFDSVALMRTTTDVADSVGIEEAYARMGTTANLEKLVTNGVLEMSAADEIEPTDLVVVAVAPETSRAKRALEEIETQLETGGGNTDGGGVDESPSQTLDDAFESLSDPSLALISVPGAYAVREAWTALHAGLHVHLFSDAVPLSAERELKQFGHEQDLLVMGPDCGTAIIDGLPLGFANAVSRGSIGIVSAAGTGLQEVASCIDRAGSGVSQAFGTGGRDLLDDVGGLMTGMCLEVLDADAATDVIVVISKPPEPDAEANVLEVVSQCDTPVVAVVLGGDTEAIRDAGAYVAPTLARAAELAVETTEGVANTLRRPSPSTDGEQRNTVFANALQPHSVTGSVRGLFSGGTLCTEAALALSPALEGLQTNVGIGESVADPLEVTGHALVDLGVDELTVGRPHPMIDPRLRDSLFEDAMSNEDVGIVLLDVVLGHGAHPNPAAGIVDALDTAISPPPVVASVCGTDGDPQSRREQVAALEGAGVFVAPTNAAAAETVLQAIDSVPATGGERP